MVGGLRLRRKQTAPGVIQTQIPTPHQYPINNKQSGGAGKAYRPRGVAQKGEEEAYQHRRFFCGTGIDLYKMRLFFLINGYFYSQFTQGSFLYKPLKTREPLGKNTPFSFFGLPPKIPPLLLHESSILVVPTSTEVGRPGCYSRLEFFRFSSDIHNFCR